MSENRREDFFDSHCITVISLSILTSFAAFQTAMNIPHNKV